jgi:rod shape-determining protein MreB and related proteins
VGVVRKLHRALWSDVAVDLGTVNTLVYTAGRGVVLDEPSVLAVDAATGEVVAVGSAAASLYGRAPEGVDVIKPLHDGVISDPDGCSLMLDAFLLRVCRHHRLGRPEALVCVPGCATSVERRALERAVGTGNIHFHVTLVPEPVAAALGSDVDLTDGSALLVVDIGGGTTEIGVVMARGIIRSRSLRVGGNEMDAAIAHEVRHQLGMVIGERTAERLKIALGLTGGEHGSVVVTGVDPTRWGHLGATEVPADLVEEALDRSVSTILVGLGDLLAEVPPDLAEEVLGRGIYLAGGGALLHGLAQRISDRSQCKVTLVQDPLRCVLRGLAMLLDQGGQGSHPAPGTYAA